MNLKNCKMQPSLHIPILKTVLCQIVKLASDYTELEPTEGLPIQQVPDILYLTSLSVSQCK